MAAAESVEVPVAADSVAVKVVKAMVADLAVVGLEAAAD